MSPGIQGLEYNQTLGPEWNWKLERNQGSLHFSVPIYSSGISPPPPPLSSSSLSLPHFLSPTLLSSSIPMGFSSLLDHMKKLC